ncbi:MAG TPA: hypothetical protein VHD63_27690, partial [Ktedonobacteraceae bacterium]|nr:hypothetical protein [Ktedonobacteraceae bacterium]
MLAFIHLWWAADGPAEDPLATDLADLHTNQPSARPGHRQRHLSRSRRAVRAQPHYKRTGAAGQLTGYTFQLRLSVSAALPPATTGPAS